MEYLVCWILGYLSREPLLDEALVEVATALVAEWEIRIEPFVGYCNAHHLSVPGRPPRSVGTEPGVFSLQIDGDFFDAVWRDR